MAVREQRQKLQIRDPQAPVNNTTAAPFRHPQGPVIVSRYL